MRSMRLALCHLRLVKRSADASQSLRPMRDYCRNPSEKDATQRYWTESDGRLFGDSQRDTAFAGTDRDLDRGISRDK